MSELSVSVVIPVYNAEDTIGNLLSALLNQSGISKQTEYIIVDNGSTDRTIEIVQKFPVTLLRESTPGPAAARNCGLFAATSDVIAHLDADTQPTRRWLAEIVAPFNDPMVMLVAGKTLAFVPQNGVERYFAQVHLFDAEANIKRPIFPFAASMNVAVRRSAAIEIGGWDESMLTTEDVDFCYRILQKFSEPIHYAPNALLLHRNRSTLEDMQRQAWTYGEGSGKLYAKYPEMLHWGWPQAFNAQRNLFMYGLWPHIIRVTKWLGLASSDAVEFAHYHHLWYSAFWAGFYNFRRSGCFMPTPNKGL
jgi:glycosyltransferase involved in cell wall biosynthesis